MKIHVIALLIIAGVISLVVLGMPLFAEQGKQQTPATEITKIESQKKQTDPVKNIEPPPRKTATGLPDTTLRFPGPEIKEFSSERPASGYFNYIFFLSPTVAPGPEKIRVRFNIYASQGLSKFEVTFNGHVVHEEAFAGPPVSSRSATTMISIQPYKPARSGNYTLQAKVTDRLGQTATKSVTMPVDFQAPGYPTIRPASGDTIYMDLASSETVDVTFWITSSDDFSGIKEVRVETDYHIYQGSDTTYPYSITVKGVRVSEADNWNIHITDNAGNMRSVMSHTLNIAPRRASMPAPKP